MRRSYKGNAFIGEKFSDWTILEYVKADICGNKYYKARCACGKEHVRMLAAIIAGRSRRCRDCADAMRKAQSQSKRPMRIKWHDMRRLHPDDVVERWQKFENFCEDMPELKQGEWLRRIDKTRPYGPGNVEWVRIKR